jgi:hypothetical protein
MTSQPSERAAVVGTIDPANHNNSTPSSDVVDMSKFHEAVFILIAGAIDSTIDFKLEESADGSSGWTDISGKAITQETGGDDDNKQWVINLKSEEMAAGKRYVRATLTIGNGTTNIVGLVALGLCPRFGPASDDDLASVSQVVT